jgi:hypothetical protein
MAEEEVPIGALLEYPNPIDLTELQSPFHEIQMLQMRPGLILLSEWTGLFRVVHLELLHCCKNCKFITDPAMVQQN